MKGDTEFALASYRQLAPREGNLAMSPLGLSLATAILYAGARGPTGAEIASVARFALPPDTLHAEFTALLDELKVRVDPWARLTFVNGIWVSNRCPPRPAFASLISEHYGGILEAADFEGAPSAASARINSLVSERTRGQVQSVVTPEQFTPLTSMVLVNAVYFLAAWAHGFSVAQTRPEPFHLTDSTTVLVDMMHRQQRARYYEDTSVQILELPYQGSGLSMLLVLPTADQGLGDLEAKLTPMLLEQWVAGLKEAGVEIAIPRFKVSSRVDLIPLLRSLGMRRAFEPGAADLSGLCDAVGLYVDQAVHDVSLGISERGTEAAAATVYVITRGLELGSEGTVSFRADHPFWFVVRDMRGGTILFMGRLTDPAS